MTRREPRPPFSRPHSVDVPAKGVTVAVEASGDEREALAADLDILGIDALSATFVLTPWRRTGLKLVGTVSGRVRQACVVTLEPVEETVEEPVELTFLPAAEIGEPVTEVEIDIADRDPPEPLDGRSIDLGAIAAEHLALGLDPYPRAPGVAFAGHVEDVEDDAPPSPFAELGKLKRNDP